MLFTNLFHWTRGLLVISQFTFVFLLLIVMGNSFRNLGVTYMILNIIQHVGAMESWENYVTMACFIAQWQKIITYINNSNVFESSFILNLVISPWLYIHLIICTWKEKQMSTELLHKIENRFRSSTYQKL